MNAEHLALALAGSFVPSKQIAAAFRTAAAAAAGEEGAAGGPVRPSRAAMAALVKLTFLEEETINHHFDKLSGELKAAAGRAGEAEAEPATPDAIAFHSDPAAYVRDRASLLQRLAAQDPELTSPPPRPPQPPRPPPPPPPPL